MSGTPANNALIFDTEAPVQPGLLLSIRQSALWKAALDLIFPPRCSGCGRVDAHWCARCGEALDTLPLLAAAPTLAHLAGIAATAEHEGIVRQAVHGLKYEGAIELAAPLARRLEQRLRQTNWTIDIIVPVPLHAARQRDRGYNQAQQLAEGLALRLSLPCFPSALHRERNTRSQVGLDAASRRANVHNAFRCQPELISGRHVLLVDDVYTTGATLGACAEAMLTAGAKAVYAITATVAQ